MKFLKSDQAKAQQELDCYHYCVEQANVRVRNGEYKEASIYLENASRSAQELERMNKSKRELDEWVRIKQIEADQHAKQLIAASRTGLRFYE